MYTRRYDDRRGSFEPPENYSGSAFDAAQNRHDSTDYQQADNPSECEPSAPVSARPGDRRDDRCDDRKDDRRDDRCDDRKDDRRDDRCDDRRDNHRDDRCDDRRDDRRDDRCDDRCDDRRDDRCDDRRNLPCERRDNRRSRGLLDGIFSRFGSFELDDLLLIGLILLLSGRSDDCDDNGDDLLLILGLLLLLG